METRKKEDLETLKIDKTTFVKCPQCGYNNDIKKTEIYGTCLKCNYVLDDKARFMHEMSKKLHLWRGKLR